MSQILFVFDNGKLNKKLSKIDLLSPMLEFHFQDNQLFFNISKNEKFPYPVYLRYFGSCESLDLKIILNENSKLTLIEEFSSQDQHEYTLNSNVNISLDKYSSIDYYKLQNQNKKSFHQSFIQVEQKESSESKLFFSDSGGSKSKSKLKVKLNERNASSNIYGLYLLNEDAQQVDNIINVEHLAGQCESSMSFKGVLDNKSKAKFEGKVYVHKNAKSTKANQENHNLLLTSKADVTSKPILEIYNDDVKCSHGSTVGQIDKDAIFYLNTRGIDKVNSIKMLIDAFVLEIIDKVDNELIQKYIKQRVLSNEPI
ncbi:Fe-S cluster assembly protein SufD [Gammaproteobacteria bacterium]|nr:Fe-S cluster assembly protein SufD [Gammaproteobacteria bacterium]